MNWTFPTRAKTLRREASSKSSVILELNGPALRALGVMVVLWEWLPGLKSSLGSELGSTWELESG